MKARLCNNCKFFQPMKEFPGDQWNGQCRYNPPSICDLGDGSSQWPEVADFDWCGKWKDNEDN